MTDYSPDYTSRYRVRYFDGFREHKAQFRYPGAAIPPPTDLIVQVSEFFTALLPILPGTFEVRGAEYANQGNSFFLPAAPPVVGTATGGAPIRKNSVNQLGFQGVTDYGNRASVSIFGVQLTPGTSDGGNWRIDGGEDSAIDAAVLILVDEFGSRPMCGIDRQPITWRPYANLRQNAYLVNRARR